MSEEMKRAIGAILEAGFQMESDAFKALMEVGSAGQLDPLVREVLRVAGTVEPRPSSISRDLVLRAAEQLDLSGKGVETEHAGLGHARRFAEELESRLEVVSDPTGKLGTTGAFDDFLHYFRNRFDKMSLLFRQRMDTRNAGTISDALQGGSNGRGRFICMVLEKREKGDRIFLTVDDYEDEATVLVGRQNSTVYEMARKIVRDQVIYIQARKSAGPLLVAESIVLPEIPDRKPNHANEEIYAALISDVHVGSKVFLENEFRRVLSWLKGEIGTPNQREVAERVQALPQPAISKDFAGPVYDSRKIVSLGDPAEVRLHGVQFLLYHGTSLMDILSGVPGLDYQRPVEAMEYQLRARHLSPEYGKMTPIGPEQEDFLVIDRVPDVFTSGHIHVSGAGLYRGTTIVNSGAWQGQTDYQKRMGLVPKPGILPVVNLKTLDVKMINFQ